MNDELPKLLVVLASTRPGRVGEAVARWYEELARKDGRFDVGLVDLKDLALPFLDEPHHPRARQYVHAHTLSWSATVDAADAVVFVTCEYNHSFPATLKNAIDFLHQEWNEKPVGFVSYGGLSGGTRAVQALKPVVLAVGMLPVVAAVPIVGVAGLIDEQGGFRNDDRLDQSAEALTSQLHGLQQRLR